MCTIRYFKVVRPTLSRIIHHIEGKEVSVLYLIGIGRIFKDFLFLNSNLIRTLRVGTNRTINLVPGKQSSVHTRSPVVNQFPLWKEWHTISCHTSWYRGHCPSIGRTSTQLCEGNCRFKFINVYNSTFFLSTILINTSCVTWSQISRFCCHINTRSFFR